MGAGAGTCSVSSTRTMIATACRDVQSSSETNAKLRRRSQSARAPATYAPGVAPTAGPMVLVVDDEPMVREVVARVPRARRHARARGGRRRRGRRVAGRPRGRPRRARRDAARRRRAVAAAAHPGRRRHARDPAHRAHRGGRPGASGSSSAPTTTSSSRSHRASWRCGCATCCAARPPAGARGARRRSAAALRGPRRRHPRHRPAAREVAVDGRAGRRSRRRSSTCSPCSPRSPRQVFSRRQLLEQVWDSAPEYQDPATVTVHVGRLRQKLRDATPSIRAGSSRRGASATGSSREPAGRVVGDADPRSARSATVVAVRGARRLRRRRRAGAARPDPADDVAAPARARHHARRRSPSARSPRWCSPG